MMLRACFVSLLLSATTASGAETNSPSVAAPQWEIYAKCAAGYQANWQDRLADTNRSHDMSNMIHEQSDDYKKAAIGFYQSEKKTSPDEASQNVARHVEANIGAFLAMDKAGTLEAYLDTCPQLDASEAK